jgi:general secretion pathway protein K
VPEQRPHGPTPGRRPRERGLALISVLWTSALLATLAAGFGADTRTESRLARNRLENAKAEALADAGVHDAAYRLLLRQDDGLWRRDRSRYRFRLGAGTTRVEITDEEARIDLNQAPAPLLAGLITAVGGDPEQADLLADRIVDFRDPDQEAEPLGAEDSDYAAAGLDHEAKDAPFLTIDELLLVLGMEPELYDRLLPHLTLFSGSEGIDPLRASPTVLRAIPGMTEEAAEQLLALGPDEDPYDVLDEDLLFEMEEYFLFSSEIMFGVRSVGTSENGGTFVREAAIELTGDPQQPFLVHDWRRGRLGTRPDDGEEAAPR